MVVLPGSNRGLVLREVLPAVAIAIVVFLGVRRFLCERYAVPTRSMEPTLHGDRHHGDRVLVDKTAFWNGARPQRWDLAVVRDPGIGEDGEQHLVKRVVSAPAGAGEFLSLRGGDLFIGPSRNRLARVVKDADSFAARSLRIESWRWPARFEAQDALGFVLPETGWRVASETIELDPAAPSLAELAAAPAFDEELAGPMLVTAGSIDASSVDAHGVRLAQRLGFVTDVGVELDLVGDLADGSGVRVVLEIVERAFRVVIAPSGAVTLQGEDDPSPRALGELTTTGHRLCVGYLDGRFFAQAGDALAPPLYSDPIEIEAPERQRIKLPGHRDEGGRRANRILVQAAGTRALRIRGLVFFHDVHYRPEVGIVYHVEPDELFLLGDHSYDSSDSRARSLEPFTIEDLVGRPVAIIGPPGRARWLVP